MNNNKTTSDVKTLKVLAEETRTLYRTGAITREEAVKEIQPYVEAFNKKSIELAKKYNQRPKKMSFNAFMR